MLKPTPLAALSGWLTIIYRSNTEVIGSNHAQSKVTCPCILHSVGTDLVMDLILPSVVKLSLCLTKYHTMKAYGRVDV